MEKISGERVKTIRQSVMMSQADFASRLGVKQSYLSSLERGVRPLSRKMIFALFKEFGVSDEFLKSGDITKNDKWADVQVDVKVPRADVQVPPKTSAKRLGKPDKAGGRGEQPAAPAEWPELGSKSTFWAIDRARFFKRHPSLDELGMIDAAGASTVGAYADRVLSHIARQGFEAVDQVLAQLFNRQITEAEAVALVTAINTPFDALAATFQALEKAAFDVFKGCLEYYPETENLLTGAPFLPDLGEYLETGQMPYVEAQPATGAA